MLSTLLADLRAAGLTQQEIADSIGVRQSQISRLENGVRGHVNPSAKVMDGLRALHKKVCKRPRKAASATQTEPAAP